MIIQHSQQWTMLHIEGTECAEQQYGQQSAAINEVPEHGLLIVLGDFDTHIHRYKYSYHEKYTC